MKNKKVLIISIIAVILVVACAVVGFIYYQSTKKSEEKEVIILAKEINSYEVNSEVLIENILDKIENVELLNGKEVIDIWTIGNKEITIKYKNLTNNVEEQKKINIDIKDTKAPVIVLKQSEIEINVGNNIDLNSIIECTDNSNGKVEIEINGEYDISKVGEYLVNYIVKDSSGNQAQSENVKIIVKEKPVEQQQANDSNSNKNNSNKTKKLIILQLTVRVIHQIIHNKMCHQSQHHHYMI